MKHCNVVIVGAGCGGLTAAIYCARAELAPVVFTDQFDKKGGMLSKTSVVENYPGYPDGIDGGELIANMEAQAIKYGTEIVNQSILSVDKEPGDGVQFRLVDDAGTVYITKAIIIATGSTPNKLGLTNEDNFWGFGVSSCAVCDGALYKNKRIIVAGGGDSAAEEALFLTKFSNVTMIHRRDSFRASTIMQNRLFSNPKINIMFNSQITKLIGSKYLEAVEVTNNDGATLVMPVDGLFYGLGLTPNINLFKHLVETDRIIKKVNRTMTSCEGIFVCGDVADDVYRQAVVAAGDGCQAALDVISYLDHL